MDEYGVTKEDVVEVLNGVVLGGGKSRFDQIESKKKAAFTREYNKRSHSAVNVFADSNTMFRKVVKGKRGKGKETEKNNTPTQTESRGMFDEDEDEDAILSYLCVCLEEINGESCLNWEYICKKQLHGKWFLLSLD